MISQERPQHCIPHQYMWAWLHNDAELLAPIEHMGRLTQLLVDRYPKSGELRQSWDTPMCEQGSGPAVSRMPQLSGSGRPQAGESNCRRGPCDRWPLQNALQWCPGSTAQRCSGPQPGFVKDDSPGGPPHSALQASTCLPAEQAHDSAKTASPRVTKITSLAGKGQAFVQ